MIPTTPKREKRNADEGGALAPAQAQVHVPAHAQPTNEIVADLGFGNTLITCVYIGADEAMSGIMHFGIVTIWHNHPVYGTHAQAGKITYHPDSGQWYKDTRERFLARDFSHSDFPGYTCIKYARARMYEMVAHDLRTYGWDIETRRD